MSPSGRWLETLTVAVLSMVSVASAVNADDGTDLLKRPLSPGVVALLAERTSEPAVLERISVGIQDPRPEVRSAAARVANVAHLAEMAPDLRKALSEETDVAAAGEEAQALVALDGPPAIADVLAAMDRLGTSAAPINGHPDFWGSLLSNAFPTDPPSIGPVASAILRHQNPTAWEAFLDLVRLRELPVEPGLLIAGLGADASGIRDSTSWHIAFTLASGQAAPPMLRATLEEQLAAAPPADETAMDSFLRDLVRRALGQGAGDDSAWVKAIASDRNICTRLKGDMSTALAALLTPRESFACSSVFGPKPAAEPTTFRIALAAGYPPGFASSIVAETRCKPVAGTVYAAATVRYRGDGRLADVGFQPLHENGRCEEAARALLLTHLATFAARNRPTEPTVLGVVFDAECIEGCALESQRAPAPRRAVLEQLQPPGAVGLSNGFRPPKKTRNVFAKYPDEARHERKGGTVLLTLRISQKGCVIDATLVQGPPHLSWAALRAVLGWRYAPATVMNEPVPFETTVTTTFTVERPGM